MLVVCATLNADHIEIDSARSVYVVESRIAFYFVQLELRSLLVTNKTSSICIVLQVAMRAFYDEPYIH